jgi:hypothetical protein
VDSINTPYCDFTAHLLFDFPADGYAIRGLHPGAWRDVMKNAPYIAQALPIFPINAADVTPSPGTLVELLHRLLGRFPSN